MNLEKANLAIKVSIEKANVIGAKFCIAIMDSGVNLVAFSRMDGAILASVEVAVKKAKTAAMFRAESGQLGGLTLVLY